ncbi:MAG TPA: DNA repair protein RadC [Vicinamibacterales bacterium]|nr:DNA repair protein RadC [Vicinamibacterales bacterium]
MATVAEVDRPREKLARVGAEALGDNELVALMIGSGLRARNALLVAQDVIAAADGVQGLARMGIDELCRVRGVGQSRAARLLAAIELGRRTLFSDRGKRPQMLSIDDIAQYLLPRYSGFAVERFGVMLLDQRQRVIRSMILSTGTIESSVSHPRDIFRVAMLGSASRVVVFHNHPSGDPMPSEADRLVTRRLALAGELMGMDLMDHMILAGSRYYSFKKAGFL